MNKAFRRSTALVAVIAATSLVVFAATATGGNAKKSANAQVAVLLPDSQSSVRWETADRPFLAAAFKKAGLTSSIVNAQGSATTQQTQAEQAITNGAKVILLVNLDSGSGAAIEKNAASHGVKVIDYDRLTLKGKASFYVSFDNVKVGKLQGQGLVSCLKASGKYGSHPVIAELNGSPTDNNATLFKQGYDSVLKPLYAKGVFKKGPDQSVPDWDNQKALTIFEQMLQRTGNKIDGVDAANDGLGNAVISALKARHLAKLPVTGQDATSQGIQNILSGDQCMTVYKAVRTEANAAAKLAISLLKGGKTGVNNKVSDGTRNVPSVLATPVAITKANWDFPIKDGYLKRKDVCNGKYAALCKK
ncbi:MAG: sugar ABC transporter substrate-binding protein [Gaiellaceae bacterium]